MTNVIQFRGRSKSSPEPRLDALVRELTTVEVELAKARLAQIKSETRQANAFWFWYWLKRVLFWSAVFWLLTTFAGAAQAQSTSRSFYNERGSLAGSSITRGKSSSFYDGQGRFSGSSIRHGNSTTFYDGRGRYIGLVINTSPRR
jgi:hypothetical protein